MGSCDNVIQCVKFVEPDQVHICRRAALSCVAGRSIRRSCLLFLLCTLYLGFIEFLENVDDVVSAVQLYGIGLFLSLKRSKFGKTGIQFLRILYLGNDEDDALCAYRDGFYH